jgi:beta-glucosidase
MPASVPPIADYDERARQIVAQMSLPEKVHLMGGTHALHLAAEMLIYRHYNRTPYPAGGNRRLGVPAMRFCDGPRGVVSNHSHLLSRGHGARRRLRSRPGGTGRPGHRRRDPRPGRNYFGGVCINLLRHPAGGRAQETFGEDPVHVGRMGAALVRGVQKHNVIACAKHFALNNQENTRFKVDVTCDERTLREVYLPHFKACVDAGVGSVMGAYNRFRGEQCCHSHYLLTDILAREWGFQGFPISDFIWGVRQTVAAANAGLDIEMPIVRFYGRKLVRAVRRGQVPEAAVDEAARRIVRTLLVFAEAPDPLPDYPKTLVASAEHVALAREVAEKTITLLKNDGDLLPFRREDVTRLAVVGKLAAQANIGDYGSSRVYPPDVVTPLQGLQRLLGEGVALRYCDGADVEAAKAAAAAADAGVFVAGYDHGDEGEFLSERTHIGGDRADLGLHADEIALIQAVAPANPRSAVVLIGGSAIMMEEWKALVPAILHAYYPGMEGGTAIAEILFGDVVPAASCPSPSPPTPPHLPPFDRQAEAVTYDLYHGYTRLEKEATSPPSPRLRPLLHHLHSIRGGLCRGRRPGEASVQVTNSGPRAATR